jgi:hypothetical protein
MVVPLIGWLLHTANTHPPVNQREGFYALKQHLLERYGRRVGSDLQHITKPCWDGPCARCWGTGIWEELWVILERWQFGRYVFYRPLERLHKAPDLTATETITGYIRHADPGPLATECALWLALRFDRALFWRMLTCASHLRWTAWPLTFLQQAGYRLRRLWRRRGLRRCDDCGHLYPQLVRPWTTLCAPCTHRSNVRQQALSKDVPF